MALSGRPGMSLRRVTVDWDDLEVALTSGAPEWAWFLDLRTGAVHMVSGAEEGPGRTREEMEEAALRGDAVRVFPLESRLEYGWMTEFTRTVDDPDLRGRLEITLHGRGAFGRFKRVLGDRPAERERWFAFREERLRQGMRAWLADHGIEPTTEPPARRESMG